MNKVIEWIISNKEWIFSGLGVAVISFVISLLIKRRQVFNHRKRLLDRLHTKLAEILQLQPPTTQQRKRMLISVLSLWML